MPTAYLWGLGNNARSSATGALASGAAVRRRDLGSGPQQDSVLHPRAPILTISPSFSESYLRPSIFGMQSRTRDTKILAADAGVNVSNTIP